MIIRARHLAGIALLLAMALGSWDLIGSDWHDTAISTVTEFVVRVMAGAMTGG